MDININNVQQILTHYKKLSTSSIKQQLLGPMISNSHINPDCPPATQRRLTEAAIRCVKRQGVEKTSLNDIAREAQCARQTLYNYYSNKHEVIYAALEESAQRFAEQLLAHIRTFHSVEDRMLEGIMFCLNTLPDDPCLQLVADPAFSPWVNPEVFHSTVGLNMMQQCTEACLYGDPALLPFIDEIAETITRIVLSMLPGTGMTSRNPQQLRDYLRRRFLPGLLNTHLQENP